MNKKSIKLLSSFFLVFLFGILLSSCSSGSIQSVSGDEARDILEKYPNSSVLIDVRTFEEHEANGIPGSLIMPYDEIDQLIEDVYPDKETHIIVYCRSGNRSGEAAETLKDMGYKNIYDMGALTNW